MCELRRGGTAAGALVRFFTSGAGNDTSRAHEGAELLLAQNAQRQDETAVVLSSFRLRACVRRRSRKKTMTASSTATLMVSNRPYLPQRSAIKTNELINAFKRVSGKENILFQIAEASLAEPDGEVREVVFPAVRGGEQTLKELVHEFKTKGPVYRRTVQTTLKASYTNHYRKGLIELLGVLEFRSNNSAYRPVIDALELVQRYAKAGNTTYYPLGEVAPEHRGTAGQWADLVHRADRRGGAGWCA